MMCDNIRMGFGNLFRGPSKKEQNREQMRRVQDQGKSGEDQVRAKWQLRGYELKRTGRGHDYYATKRDPLTNRVVDSKYIEAKSGEHARPSKLQEKMKKKYGSRYVVDRVDPNPLYNASKSSDMFGSSSSSRKKRSSSGDVFGNMFGSSSGSGRKRKSDSIWGTGSSVFGSSSPRKRKSKGSSNDWGIW